MKAVLFGSEEVCAAVTPALARFEDVDPVLRTSRESDLLGAIDAAGADLALICLTGEAAAYRAAQQVYQLRPRCLVAGVLASPGLTLSPLGLVGSGIVYVVNPWGDATAEQEALRSACDLELSRQAAISDAAFAPADSQIIALYGVKDGLGKTSMAVNLGLLLTRAGKKTVVLDFDLQFGDCARHLGLAPRRTLTELLQDGDNPSIDRIRQNVALHSSGLNVLPAPANPEFAEQITAGQIDNVIGTLKGYYDYILIDMPTAFNDIAAVCAEKANRILLLTGPTIPLLANTKKTLLLIDLLGQRDKVDCVLVHVGKGDRIGLRDVQKALEQKVWATVPFDVAAADAAVNPGVPLVVGAPRSDVARAYGRMAETLMADEEVPGPAATTRAGKKAAKQAAKAAAERAKVAEERAKAARKDARAAEKRAAKAAKAAKGRSGGQPGSAAAGSTAAGSAGQGAVAGGGAALQTGRR